MLLEQLSSSLAGKIAQITEKQQQSAVDEIQAQLQQQPLTTSQIEDIEKKLNKLDFQNDSTEELKRQLATIKNEKAEKERLEREMNEKLRMLTEEIAQIQQSHPSLAGQATEKSKKRKKKEAAKPASTSTSDRGSQIAVLKKNAELIETKILPSLKQLQDGISAVGIENEAPQTEAENAAKLLSQIKVRFILTLYKLKYF